MVMTKVSRALRVQGFTLIEVMIVVVIVAILAAVALPSYQQHVMKSRRVDAKETLTRLATLQERFFFQNSKYARELNKLGVRVVGGENLSPEGWYELAITFPNGGCADDADACNNFKITASPVDPGPQASDTRCTTLSINQTLLQEATGSDADNCW